MNKKSRNEINHGKHLVNNKAEFLWGWNTDAGKIRAKRRSLLISEGAKLNINLKVLEIGCGTGMFTQMFSKSKANITAVDISPDLINLAINRNSSSQNITFINKRFEDCNNEGPFDAIIGSSILHHLEIEDSLKIMYKLLKSKGIISFAEPNLLNPQVFLERKFRNFFPYVSPDEVAFTKWQIEKYLKSAGFINIHIFPFDWLHPVIPKILIPFISTLGNILELIPIIKNFSGSLYIKAEKP